MVQFRYIDIKRFKPMLANDYLKQNVDLSNFFMSEKLDGVRCIYYDGNLFSRTLKQIHSPKWFTDYLQKFIPKNIVLDGELFTKQSDFTNILSITSKKYPIDKEWKNITFMCFDIPNLLKPFKERYDILQHLLNNLSLVKVVEHFSIKDINHLQNFINNIVQNNGEGVMLRDINSYYENNRSNKMLKYKLFKDSEVIVVDHELGSGKNSNILGSITVKWLDQSICQHTFNVGSGFTNTQRINYKALFPINSILKIKYFELTDLNIPRFPTFIAKLH